MQGGGKRKMAASHLHLSGWEKEEEEEDEKKKEEEKGINDMGKLVILGVRQEKEKRDLKV